MKKRFFCSLAAFVFPLCALLFTCCATPVKSEAQPPSSAAVPVISFVPVQTAASVIVWTDPVFEEEVRYVLSKPEGEPITEAELQAITSLSLTAGVTSLADLRHFQNLRELWVVYHDALEQPLDLSPIGELKQLTSLTLSLSGEEYDFALLENLPNLTALSLQWHSAGADISVLSSLTALTNLGLIEMTELDLKELSGLTQLDALYLKYCAVEDITPLEPLVNLKILALQDSPNLCDLSPVAGMKDLAFLDLTGCIGIKSLEPLRNLEKLTELFIPDDPALDRSPVAHVKYINGLKNMAP